MSIAAVTKQDIFNMKNKSNGGDEEIPSNNFRDSQELELTQIVPAPQDELSNFCDA